jgi:pimeloyl-ACP methyl ester carboxylesterase
MKPQPAWIDKTFFPFDSKWINIEGNDIHYVDEGKGETFLFVHGTPEWSFGFRDLIKGLSKQFRCVAIDHLGFGLSDKPETADYTCKAHALRLEKFIQKLNLQNITLVANDFGGGIGLSYAIAHPENIKRVVLFNTWMWSLKNDKHYSNPSKIVNTWFGKFLYLKLNAPVNTIMPSAYGNKKKLTKQIHAHYKNALPSGKERIAAYAFAKELMNASDWWQSLWNQIDKVENKPFLIFWGMKDSFIPPYELNKWKSRLPQSRVVTYNDAGHFVHEEKSEEMIAEIMR